MRNWNVAYILTFKLVCLKGKEIIEYYLRQLEDEGITSVPRWTPPALAPSAETAASCRKRASLAVVVPEAAQKEGLSSEALSTPSGASEPATAGTPDGGFILRAGPASACSRFLSGYSARSGSLRTLDLT